MQKLIITSLCIFLSSAGISQINRGDILLGGDIGYYTVEYDEGDREKDKANTFQLSPSIGIALKKNSVLGINASYFRYKLEEPSILWFEETREIGFGVFIRQYQLIISNFHLFGQATFGYAEKDHESGSLYFQVPRSTKNAASIHLSAIPGLAYKAGKKFFLELALKDLFKIEFRNTKTTAPSTGGGPQLSTERNDFSVSSSVGSIPLNIGMRFIFN